MKWLFLLTLPLILLGCRNEVVEDQNPKSNSAAPAYAMVIHGGAGTILKENMTEEKEQAYISALQKALLLGKKLLSEGSIGVDVVEKVINTLEDNPLFNAGKGAVFTHEGKNEMDASIMDGSTQNAGAVGGVTTVKHPISAAKAVMNKSPHVLLTGNGAEAFAQEMGCEIVDPKYFYTERRWESLQKLKAKAAKTGFASEVNPDYKYGTVGAVVLDKFGNIAAGTSTGGMTNKKYGRIGDSPIIGAGTYADNATCGISSTGHGEYFIRYAVAYDIAAQMDYAKISLKDAARYTIQEKLKEKKGSGGVVGLDKMGNIIMEFNTAGMYRGFVLPDSMHTAIYKK